MKEEFLVSNDQLSGRLFRKFLMPSVFALLASNLSSMIDTVIIGHALSEKGLAAMSLVAPVSLLYFTAGSMTAVGASILTGIALGENKRERAGSFFTLSFLLAGGFALLFTLFGLANLDRIPVWLGAKTELVPLVKRYCFYYICGGAAPLFFYIPFNFLKIAGKPNISMLLLLTMGSINIALTLVFVYRFHMGTGGAALATQISLACAFLLGCAFLFGRKRELKPGRPDLSVRNVLNVFSSGSAAAFGNLSRAIMVILMNFIIARVGSGLSLSIYTVSRNINDLFMTVVLGVSQSVVPLVSLFYGEKDNEHIRMIVKKALRTGSGIAAVCAVVVIVCSGGLIRLFGITDMASFGKNGFFSIFCVAAALNLTFINTLFLNYYSGVQKAGVSNFILVCRTAATALAAYALGSFFGELYLWLCYPAAEAAVLCVWYGFTAIYRKKSKKAATRFWLLDPENEDLRKSLNFSVRGEQEDILNASERIGGFCGERGLSPQQGMVISLAVEELLILLAEKCFRGVRHSGFDLRLFITEEEVLLRIRCFGKRFNPVEYYEESDDELSDSMGVGMIRKTATLLQYSEMFGMNNLLILV